MGESGETVTIKFERIDGTVVSGEYSLYEAVARLKEAHRTRHAKRFWIDENGPYDINSAP